MPLQVLKYMIGIEEDHINRTEKYELAPVYPVIIYSGKKPWRFSVDFFDLFGDNKELGRDLWTSPCQLIDLTQVSDEELEKHLLFGFMIQVAKHVHDPDILPFIKAKISTFRKIENKGERWYVNTVISYVLRACETKNQEDLFQTLARGLRSLDEDKIMTIADELRAEGEEKGRVEGERKNSENIALSMLKEKFPIDSISRVTKLPISQIQNMMKSVNF